MRARGGWRWIGAVGAVVVASVSLVGCSGDDDNSTTSTTTAGEESVRQSHAVGVTTDTYVDSRRLLTAAAGSQPTERLLDTTIFYPAEGAPGGEPVADAPADRDGGPYPLIVFAHGLGASPQAYQQLLPEWAAAGYVVAAPAFPKTNTAAVGGVDPGDFANQPADVSAIISAIERRGRFADGPLAAMVDGGKIGIAGHSLGGITTLGAAANSCCRDERVKAAVVMAGDPLTFPKGDFDYAKAPPLLLVHGTADDLITYEASVDVFNDAQAPKGLLTIKNGDHSAPIMNPTIAGFDDVVRTTVDFFDAYLKDDAKALDRLEAERDTVTTRLVFVAEPGTTRTLPTAPTQPARQLQAKVTPDRGLTNGQTVTVSWSGFTPGNTINIVQCSNRTAGDASACDLKTGKILQPNPTGSGSLEMQVVTGPVGTGNCDADHADCQMVFNDGGSLDPSASVRVSLVFAPS